MEQTKRPWLECLDLVKTYMGITPHGGGGLTPFEALYGRPFVLPMLEGAEESKSETPTLAEWMRKMMRERGCESK